MAARLALAPKAEHDIQEAYDWYEERRPGLGEDFLSCVDASIQTILRRPDVFAKVHDEYRRIMVRRFLYAVFYEYVESTVTVYCVFHTSRDPDKWGKRLP